MKLNNSKKKLKLKIRNKETGTGGDKSNTPGRENPKGLRSKRSDLNPKSRSASEGSARSSGGRTPSEKRPYGKKKGSVSRAPSERVNRPRGDSKQRIRHVGEGSGYSAAGRHPLKRSPGRDRPVQSAKRAEMELPETEMFIPVQKKVDKEAIKLSGEESVSRLKRSLTGSVPTLKDTGPWRINRFLASCGYGSRRQVEDYVLAGRVEVNGKKVRGLDVRIQEGDIVSVDGKVVTPNESALYYALNKPEGYVVSNRRFPGEENIYDLLPESLRNLKYAGRLDKNSRGLVIFSTDGQFIAAVTHPGRRLTKRYLVTVDHLIPETELQSAFYRGILSEGELLRAVRVAVKDREKKIVEVVLGEGKKRQIRRMFKSLNIEVLDLYRVAVGFLDLTKKHIEEGKFATFTPSELLYGKESKESELPSDFNPWDR